MNKKVKIGNGGTFTISDKYYKAAGGEASIYVNGGRVFKIYHDPHKTLPAKKIKELSAIRNKQVVVPQDLIFDASTGDPLGYTANYIDNVEPLLKLFTRTFKQDNNVDPAMIAELVKQLQLVTGDIHGAKCLIVDFNELNVLVNVTPTLLTPYFIDVDSYATPSYNATAIMDSVRDRRVSSEVNGKLVYNADELSDWYSWGIISFWLYTNIHPFRGNAKPKYNPCDKQKQMDDNVSVFHAGVKMPPSVNNFNVIPKRHLDWYKDTFLNNNRSIPPLPDSIAPLVVPAPIVIVKGNKNVDVIEVAAYSENVLHVLQSMGINYVVTQKKVYCGAKELMFGCDKAKKVLLCAASDGSIIVGSLAGQEVKFVELNRQRDVGTIASTDIFTRNGAIYSVSNGKLVENCFTALGDKMIHRIKEVENISEYTAVVYDGCVIQDLLGKKHLTLPYKKGECFTKYLPQLDGYRIVAAKSERNVVVILAEKGGQYDRFVIVFTKDFSDFDVRKIEDVAYDSINFTVLESGLCLLLANQDELEMFVNNQNIQVIKDPPIDNTMKLFNTPDGAFFLNSNSIHQIKKK